jgi:phosphoribosylformimino-5-aminoimidazole carboxamide ribotide isomerase
MFEIFPAVDIQRGRVVRLFEGRAENETVYFDNPLDAAQHWVDRGASWLHLVDLDAAFGKGDNRGIIAQIAKLPCKCEVGGGVRSLEVAERLLDVVERVIVGTAAVLQPELVDALLARYGAERVGVSIDARGGLVAVKGWTETSAVAATALAERVTQQGVTHLIYTDVARDGTLLGVDPEPVSLMRRACPHTLVAGGGVASERDLELYESLGLDGAIVGKALYEGRIRYPRAA